MADLARLIQAIEAGDRVTAVQVTTQAVAEGMHPQAVLDAMTEAMGAVGGRFQRNEIFVPEMLVSAVTMKAGLEVVKPHLAGGQSESRGTIMMATVQGDVHDIGKNLVSMMLEGAGFKVMDLGMDLSVDTLIDQVKTLQIAGFFQKIISP